MQAIFGFGVDDLAKRDEHVSTYFMRNVGAADLVRRVQSLERRTARKPPTEVEAVALSFVRKPSYRGAVDVLVEINREGGVSAHRPAVLRACIKALQLCDGPEGLSFHKTWMANARLSVLCGHCNRHWPG